MNPALDLVYALVAAATAPWWMRKARSGWAERFGRIEPLPPPRQGKPRLLLHTVSVGETNLIRPLVGLLAPHADLVVSASTDTGLARARELYASTCHVTRFPLDASWSVRRFLRAVRPDAVALVELELWPNFCSACRAASIPVAVINGRLSRRSFRRYRLGRAVVGRYFRMLHAVAAQDDDYAQRFIAMGVPAERCTVTGSMKWDSAHVADSIPGADELAAEMGIDRSKPLIVAGSTAPGEHELFHAACPPGVQLLCAPRRPEWCDQAASALGPRCTRRTARTPGRGTDRFLLDTIGELRRAYALADVVVVGRSFGNLYGSDPMEPAALAKPVIIGPAVTDFAGVVETMRRAGAIVQVPQDQLTPTLTRLLSDPDERRDLARRARDCVLANQGATRRCFDVLMAILTCLPARAGDSDP